MFIDWFMYASTAQKSIDEIIDEYNATLADGISVYLIDASAKGRSQEYLIGIAHGDDEIGHICYDISDLFFYKKARVHYFEIFPAFHRQGYGQKLFSFALVHLKQRGVRNNLTLRVAPLNHRARLFYEKNGLAAIKRETEWYTYRLKKNCSVQPK